MCDAGGVKILKVIISSMVGILDVEVKCCTEGWRHLAVCLPQINLTGVPGLSLCLSMCVHEERSDKM